MGAAHLLNEIMVARFDGGANQTITADHNVEYNRQDHDPQDRIAEPGRRLGQCLEGLPSHGPVKLCAALHITPLKSAQTNGTVERCNGRIEDVPQSHHLRSDEKLDTALHRYVRLYNQQHPPSVPGRQTPFKG